MIILALDLLTQVAQALNSSIDSKYFLHFLVVCKANHCSY